MPMQMRLRVRMYVRFWFLRRHADRADMPKSIQAYIRTFIHTYVKGITKQF